MPETINKSYEIDMCSGPILPKLLRFSFPLMLSGILQLLFNAADIIVVGRFTGKEALAAVGSTGALTNCMINIFMGLSIGTNVQVARYVGAKDEKNAGEAVHTAILLSILCGTAMIFIGGFLAEPLLNLMGTPDDVINQAVLYMRVYFLGMPALMLYNFASAVLRAVGDTRRPLVFLTAAGVVNVICNLFFVIVMKWGVAGVASATTISQTISALLVLICLMKEKGICRVQIKRLRIYRDKLFEMMKIGLPAGIQGSLFALSNTVIQSSVNSFGSVAMAGNAAAANIEGFVWTAMNAITQAAISFTSQNIGARRFSRINRIALLSLGTVAAVGLTLGPAATLFGSQLLGIYNSSPDVIAFGIRRMYYICLPYFLCGFMDVMGGCMRGLGYSVLPTIVSLTGACLMRIVWIMTIFAHHHTPDVLYVSYPISWIITGLIHALCFVRARRHMPDHDMQDSPFY